MDFEKFITTAPWDRIKDPGLRAELDKVKGERNNAIKSVITDSFMAVVRAVIAVPSMIVPTGKGKKGGMRTLGFEPKKHLQDNWKKSGAHAEKALKSLAIFPGKTAELAFRGALAV